jgi:hypothetical protein
VDSEATVPALLAVAAGAYAVAWTLRRLRPGLPAGRRLVYILGGGIVVGGMLYGMILGR